LARFVDNLQTRHRATRDRFVLEQALQAHRERFSGEQATSVEELLDKGLLKVEPHSLFDRYTIEDGVVSSDDVSARDLQNPSYLRSYKSRTIEYLLPPLTENDLHHETESTAEERELLLSDRYRLPTLLVDDVLWIANDVAEIEAVVDRGLDELPNLSESPVFQAVSAQWSGREKVRAFFDVDRLMTLGLLSPESQVQETAKQALHDLRNHPAISFDLKTKKLRNRMTLSVRLIHRSALVSE
jgi:hypothetical protein